MVTASLSLIFALKGRQEVEELEQKSGSQGSNLKLSKTNKHYLTPT